MPIELSRRSRTRAHAGLLDTSVLIATETGRPLDIDALPDELFISVPTIAELQAGASPQGTGPLSGSAWPRKVAGSM